MLDTGIDLTHPDLLANLDWPTLGKNCYSSGPPQDGHGHGTHVSGTIAGVKGNGKHVMYVEDDQALVFLVERLLKRRGFRVSGFSDPNLATFPGLAIFGAVLAFNLVGDGLRDALDPRLR